MWLFWGFFFSPSDHQQDDGKREGEIEQQQKRLLEDVQTPRQKKMEIMLYLPEAAQEKNKWCLMAVNVVRMISEFEHFVCWHLNVLSA